MMWRTHRHSLLELRISTVVSWSWSEGQRYTQDQCNCSIAIIMTGPCKHCPLSTLQLCIAGYSPHWGLDNEASRHSHNYRGANILIGDKLPSKLSKHVGLNVGQNTSIDRTGPRWPLSLQPRPTVMSVGWIYVSKWSPTWHFYFAPQPSGWELLSNDLPGCEELSGTLRVGVFDSAWLQKDPWCLHDFWLAPWEWE